MSGRPLPLPDKEPQELYVRRGRRNGRSVASLRALDYGSECVVEALLGEVDGAGAADHRSYRFSDVGEATAFVSEVVEAMMYLGCEIGAE
jgi:hypothetical protein